MKSLHITVAPEIIAHLGPVKITNSLLTSLIVMVFLITVALFVKAGGDSKKRSKLYIAVEMIVEKAYMFFKNIAGDRTEIIFPLLMTFFLFIIFGNWIGLLPGVGSIGFYENGGHDKSLIPILRGPNADLNTTFALALISVSVTQYLSIKTLGFRTYMSKFINLKNPIKFFVGVLELVSEFAKILSFSFRLFGNIFAGEVLLSVMIFLIPILVPVPFLILEVFVGFIQALVFTMLTTIFVVIATEESHE
ncbi:ATP synthase F0 subunit A [Candidatus Woesebacteria bacterium RIFCSPLOWO2_01_FULL_39_23]|uniref:ATP synthase subunit a n=1 Tax=Candidatus Woesebacteria bacterium RIFCSPHIGHO2_01_FULL_40_22 TaxID=1802499 RepID=A0A1F7YM43_9BACT|nr:MAG: ATP synthase F0 subunit A [Candidatus Woesebacteria bacterium RBG_16_40_11]OGM27615.1 MAG: ATP synthase F0 subunit A [Candidatus Woesebacteria bacterium RIFCSPHIGHO2_01_FULL_40_22]OGM36768.1 MAG: ATP synthase F0 subunit A [Candidatus Woesebacteria bacterium RIFCSPHIGHO2_12_FULL_38_9]OGM62789.1 MAG: ATP synthase F0 subunit A [Candidatus Woesebacteria bacterium RIFCSPLOWO2_01_FULL_39_23]